MAECSLCRPDLAPVLAESEYWRLVLNHNQNLLGKCFWVLRRHFEEVALLDLDEWLDLHQQLTHSHNMLEKAFAPDHFNYAFLQNQDRHVHLHIIPRYRESRTFEGIVFTDPDYPGHYAVPAPAHELSDEQYVKLAAHLRQKLMGNVKQS